jgi:intracellular septation protein A
MSAAADRRAQVFGVLSFVFGTFGPLIVFYGLLALFGLKAAIGGLVVFFLLDLLRHRLRRIPFTRIYLLTAGLTVAFGLIDIAAQTPFMLSYESVITSVAFGVFFAAGARGKRPLIQEFAEQAEDKPFPERADVVFFFRLLTLLWAGYFFLEASAYLWLARTQPVERAMEIRSVAGPVGLGLMFLFSLQGRRLFALLRRLGWLPVAEPTP